MHPRFKTSVAKNSASARTSGHTQDTWRERESPRQPAKATPTPRSWHRTRNSTRVCDASCMRSGSSRVLLVCNRLTLPRPLTLGSRTPWSMQNSMPCGAHARLRVVAMTLAARVRLSSSVAASTQKPHSARAGLSTSLLVCRRSGRVSVGQWGGAERVRNGKEGIATTEQSTFGCPHN